MLGTKMIGRSLVFGLGYLAGTRAGRDRYDQIQRAALSFAGQLRQELDAAPDKSPSVVARCGAPGLGRQRHQARAAVSPRCSSASTS